MTDSQLTIEGSQLRTEITKWLGNRLDPSSMDWITEKSERLWDQGEDWEFFTAFSAVPRYTGKKKLSLSGQEQDKARKIRPGWEPAYWTVEQLGRILLLLSITNRDRDDFLETLEKTHQSSDMGEAEVLYKGLPLLPYPEQLRDRAAEGIRSNMTSLFNAVALRNPYPADYFDDGAWNQLVLKALFVESPLYLIQGIDRRANKKLARMLVDYAHERWAAGRSVSPELWRPVGPFAEGPVIEDLQKVLDHPDELQQQAALLALAASPSEKAKKRIATHGKATTDWDKIGRECNKQNTDDKL